MKTLTKILIVEHDLHDIDLLENEFKKDGINYISEVVKDKHAYTHALKHFIPDIILSDFTLPSFDGPTAFKIREELVPETPFIFVTGTIGEERSIDFIRSGVTDYVLKENLIPLSTKVKRALKEAKEKKQKKKAEIDLIQNERQFRHTLDNMIEGIQLHDFNWRYIYVNDALVKSSGFSREELIGLTVMEKYPGIEQTDLFKAMQRCMTDRVAEHLETVFIFPDGKKADFELSIQPIAEGISILSIDRTAQKSAKEKLLKANRLNAFISQVNQKIVRVENEEALFRNACSIALGFAKFKMAWIGKINYPDKKITLIAQSGIADEDILLFTDVPLQNDGPQDYVMRTGNNYVCNDIEHDLELQSWKPFATKHDIRSVMVLPIKKSGNVTHTFNLYATELNFFTKEEIKLMEDLADDISFALDLFEKEKKQKDTEKQIVHQENLFGALIENSADMKALTSKEGRVLYGSPAILKGLGYSFEEFLNIYPQDLIHPDDLKNYIEKRDEIIKRPGASFHYLHRRRHKDGRWIWCEGSITNRLDDPAIKAMVSNFRDVSERMEMEKQHEFDRNNLDALINNTGDLMWSVDKDFNLITSNLPFDEMAKLNFGQIIPKGSSVLSAAYSPEMLSHFKQLYKRAFAGESFTETEHFDYPVEMWSEISYYPIKNGDEIIGTACHSRDITERKSSEGKLIQSEARLEEAQALSHISNWEVDLVTGISTWSDEFYHIFGITREDVQPSPEAFLTLIHLEDFNTTKEEVEKTFKTLEGSSFYARAKTKDGSTKYIFSEWEFEFDKNNKPLRLYGILQDITERKLAEAEREKITADLLQRNKDLEQFTYIVSHNLRAPVANIMGISGALRTMELNEQDKEEMMHGLSASTMKLNGVIRDLNDILQIKKNVTEKREKVSFSHLIKNIKITISELIKNEQVEIITDFSKVDKMLALKSYLYSIFFNLISNSIKYRQPELSPIIDIRSYVIENKIEIHYQDNGLGIDMKNQSDKVFGLYKRFHTHKEGKGMGLFMVKTQVEALGGKINIESEVNKGTKFIIQFPL